MRLDQFYARAARFGRRLVMIASTAALAESCSASDASNTNEAPLAELTMSTLVDTSSDPDVVEVKLAASTGKLRYLADGIADIWGYRDASIAGSKPSVPGPVLEAKLGQKVIVHFKNELSEPTTIHWHGLRVPNTSDGTPSVQVEVAPGGTFDYEFEARDAGTFWYHPHVRGDVQVERGLYGAVVVRGGITVPVTTDRVFILDDVKLEANGKLSENTTPLDVMLGRQGNVLLANGKPGGEIVVKSGARERWRFINAANGRYFNLRLKKHTFSVVSWDGGLIAEPYDADTLLIAPGERYEVLVEFPDASGGEFALETLHYDRGHDVPDPGPQPVFKVAIQGSTSHRGSLPDTWGEPIELNVPDDAMERSIELAEEENAGQEFPNFFINGAAYPDVPPIEARPGDVEIWRIFNNSEMDHPFHLHGMFFRVLTVGDEAPAHDGWKDTVNIPQKQTLRFAVRYGDEGTWMYHCHIQEHAERGMMGELRLTP